MSDALGNKKIMAENITRFMKAKQLKTADLARALNVPYTTASDWVKGKTYPRIDKIEMLSHLFNVEKKDLVEKYNPERSNVSFLPYQPAQCIPILGSVPAGVPIEAIEDYVGETAIPKSWVKPGVQYIALKVTGDSMYPKYEEDDTIIIKVQGDFHSGDDCVVYVNGYDATLKTVIKEPDGTITLQPINPDYEAKNYGPDSDPIRILGVVVRLERDC